MTNIGCKKSFKNARLIFFRRAHPNFWSTPRSRRTLMRLRGSQEMVNTSTTATNSLGKLRASDQLISRAPPFPKEEEALKIDKPLSPIKFSNWSIMSDGEPRESSVDRNMGETDHLKYPKFSWFSLFTIVTPFSSWFSMKFIHHYHHDFIENI